MKQVIKTFCLRKWWHIGLEGSIGVKGRKEGSNSKRNCASYRTITCPLIIRPLFLPFTPSSPICHQLSHGECFYYLYSEPIGSNGITVCSPYLLDGRNKMMITKVLFKVYNLEPM